MKRREQKDIAADILNESKQGSKISRIVYKCNLNFKIVRLYLSRLLSEGLLEVVDKNVFRTTEKGRIYLKSYRDFKALWSQLDFSP